MLIPPAILLWADAIVTDKSGKGTADLSPDAFEVLQDGKTHNFTRFAFIPTQTGPTPRPPKRADPNAIPIPPPAYKPDQVRRAIVLVVDDLALSFESMYYVRDAIKTFTASLQPGDLFAMLRTGSGAGAFQSFTTDHNQISQLAGTLRWSFRSRTGVSSFKPFGGDTVPADEPNTDSGSSSESEEDDLQNRAAGLGTFAAMEWIVNGLAPAPGRNSIILLSDGFKLQTRPELNGSLTDPLRRLTDQASRAGVVIYSIDPRGLPSLALGAADDTRNPRRAAREQKKRTRDYQQSQEPLLTLTADTGGRAFMNRNDVGDSLRRVLDD